MTDMRNYGILKYEGDIITVALKSWRRNTVKTVFFW